MVRVFTTGIAVSAPTPIRSTLADHAPGMTHRNRALGGKPRSTD